MSKAVIQAMEQLIDVSLNSEEKHQLVRKLQRDMWGARIDALLKRVDERQKGLPPISMEEIVQEVKAVRRARAPSRRH